MPSLLSTHSSPDPIATNTLIITNLPPSAFQDSGETIRAILERYGKIWNLAILKSFRRMIAVYESTMSAFTARGCLHHNPILGPSVGVYFGEHTDRSHIPSPTAGHDLSNLASSSHLKVPEPERNFLLSPPGSPPVDWVQLRELSPVPGGHNDALYDALKELEDDGFLLDGGTSGEDSESSAGTVGEDTMTPGRHVLQFTPPEGEDLELPMIVVENTDIDNEEMSWANENGVGTRLGIPQVNAPIVATSLPVSSPSTLLPRTPMPPVLG